MNSNEPVLAGLPVAIVIVFTRQLTIRLGPILKTSRIFGKFTVENAFLDLEIALRNTINRESEKGDMFLFWFVRAVVNNVFVGFGIHDNSLITRVVGEKYRGKFGRAVRPMEVKQTANKYYRATNEVSQKISHVNLLGALFRALYPEKTSTVQWLNELEEFTVQFYTEVIKVCDEVINTRERISKFECRLFKKASSRESLGVEVPPPNLVMADFQLILGRKFCENCDVCRVIGGWNWNSQSEQSTNKNLPTVNTTSEIIPTHRIMNEILPTTTISARTANTIPSDTLSEIYPTQQFTPVAEPTETLDSEESYLNISMPPLSPNLSETSSSVASPPSLIGKVQKKKYNKEARFLSGRIYLSKEERIDLLDCMEAQGCKPKLIDIYRGAQKLHFERNGYERSIRQFSYVWNAKDRIKKDRERLLEKQ